MNAPDRVSIAILSEDASSGTRRALEKIVSKMLIRFDHRGAPTVELASVSQLVARLVRANRWRGADASSEQGRRELWRYIARKLSEPHSVVVFHYDGDTSWSNRDKAISREQFDKVARLGVRQALLGATTQPFKDEVERRMANLLECVPFYSIEAWLYQSTGKALELCRASYSGADCAKFSDWNQDRTLLDEVLKPKDQTCLRDRHNEELADGVPMSEVLQVGLSLTWFAWVLHASPELGELVRN